MNENTSQICISCLIDETALVESETIPAAEKKEVKVISTIPLDVHTKPNGFVIGQLQPNDIVEFLAEEDGWAQIKTSEFNGFYCESQFLAR